MARPSLPLLCPRAKGPTPSRGGALHGVGQDEVARAAVGVHRRQAKAKPPLNSRACENRIFFPFGDQTGSAIPPGSDCR